MTELATSWAAFLRELADKVDAGEVKALYVAAVAEDGAATWAMPCDAKARHELGQNVAIDCEDMGWRCPWDEVAS